MNKKTTVILLVVLAALIGAYFAFVHKWHGPDNEFHVTDSNTIGKVQISKVHEGADVERVILTRQGDDSWTVNDSFPASQAQVGDFLQILAQIRVKEPISDKAQATSLSLLKQNHTRVVISDRDGGTLRDYLIGPTNNPQSANIYKMAWSDHCYMVSKPGMDGYVSIYYSTRELDWRDKAIWNLKGSELTMVSAIYSRDTLGQSFVLSQRDGKWQLLSPDSPADPGRVSTYMSLFNGKVNAESYAALQYPEMMDSLKRRLPDARLTLQDVKGKRTDLLLFARPDVTANFFAYIEGKNELLTVQHFVIDPFLKQRAYFVGME